MSRLLLIVNPAAGMGRGAALEGDIAHLYASQGWRVTLCETATAGDAARFAIEEAASHKLVLCVGGDGTLSETLGGLIRVPNAPPLCYVPMGSTNDLAQSAGLPHDPLEAAAVGLNGRPLPIDAGTFNGQLFSYVACFGAFTRTSYETDRALKNRIGHLAYVLSGLQELGRIESYPVTIRCEEEEISGDFIFGSVCNTRSLGGILKLPLGYENLRDGLHELIMVRQPKRATDLGTLLSSLLGGHLDHPLLVYRQITNAVFNMPAEMPWSLDGERADAGERVEIMNLRHAYQLMIPNK